LDSHAHGRARDRFGIALRPWSVLRPIRRGEAKLVDYGEQERLIYDVPYEGTTVRVVVNKELDWVVSVLPPKFRVGRDKYREHQENSRKTRREFFRGFEGDE
jgi:hypothetical protein